MARGPKGEKRPDDLAAAAVAAICIGLGEAAERFVLPVRETDPPQRLWATRAPLLADGPYKPRQAKAA
jgi:hypothetical protein